MVAVPQLQLDPQNLKYVIDAANGAEILTRKIMESDGFEDRKGWNLDVQNEEVTVHYKDFDGKRYFAAQTTVPLLPTVGFNFNWNQVGSMADWNKNVKFSNLVGRIGTDVDLTHYASNQVLAVSSREFVVARKAIHVNDNPVVAAASCEGDIIQETKGSVRAVLHLGFGRYVQIPTKPGLSRYDYVVSMDLKGMMPTYLVNQVLGKMVLSDVENHRKNLVEYSKTDCE